jgi:CheY-like chemotaxis protein
MKTRPSSAKARKGGTRTITPRDQQLEEGSPVKTTRGGWRRSWHPSGGDERDGLRVLVVEDNEDSAASMAMLLRLGGHEVQVAPNGPAAMEAARDGLPDVVVLLDIGLPGMDGHTVARWMGEQPGEKRPLLIAVTEHGQGADRRHSAEAGIDLHLVKPVDPERLQTLLGRFQAIIE